MLDRLAPQMLIIWNDGHIALKWGFSLIWDVVWCEALWYNHIVIFQKLDPIIIYFITEPNKNLLNLT